MTAMDIAIHASRLPEVVPVVLLGFEVAGRHIGAGGGRPMATVTDPDGNVPGLLRDR